MVEEGAQLAENVPTVNEALHSISALHKPDILAHICSTCTQEVKASGWEIQGHSCLHSEFSGEGMTPQSQALHKCALLFISFVLCFPLDHTLQ